MSLSIAERRTISSAAYWDDDFRKALLDEPVSVLSKTLGRPIAADTRVEFMHETDKWCFVMLDADKIDAELPAAVDARSAVENDVYSLLRDRPDLADAAAQDPVGFVRSHFDIDMDGFDVDLRREGPGSAIIVLQNIEEREQLSDDMLDLVSAGGAPTTATTTASTNRDS